MSKFALVRIDAIVGKQEFDKLFVDDNCEFDDFEKDVQKHQRYASELGMIYRYMEVVSDNKTPPSGKFKDITPEKELVKEYEFRTKHLRVYAIKKKNGKIIVLGGYKNRQPKDLRKFRSIKKRYLNAK